MKMFKSYYDKNNFKISVLLWASKSCYDIQDFYFKQKQLCGDEYQYTTSSFLFFLKKSSPKKQNKQTNKQTLLLLIW